MKAELQQKLYENYPEIFKQRPRHDANSNVLGYRLRRWMVYFD